MAEKEKKKKHQAPMVAGYHDIVLRITANKKN